MKSMPILIAAFVAVIVGVMLIGSIATETYGKTGRGSYVADESLNLSTSYNGASGFMNQTIMRTLANKGVQCYNGDGKWVSGSVYITNSSGTVLTSGNYTVDYSNQTIVFKNTSTTDPVSYAVIVGAPFFKGNITLIDYAYYPSDYMCEGWQRTVLNMVPGFFGIAILAIGIGMFYKVAQEEGIIGKL